jgi:hypothetical protein
MPNDIVSVQRIGLATIMPDRLRTSLRYWKLVTFNLAVTSYGSVRFSPSNAFDIDPLIGGTAMSGFTEVAAFYNRYRVLSSTIVVMLNDQSATIPLTSFLAPVNVDPGATPAAGYNLAIREQPYAKSCLSGLLGSPPVLLRANMSTEKIFGSKMALYDDAFSAVVSASPTNNWFWVVGVNAPAVIATSVYVDVRIEVDVEFFDRFFLQN